MRGNAAVIVRNQASDIAFLDPPYEHMPEYAACLQAISESGSQLAIAQHDSRVMLESEYGVLKKARVLRQGDNSLSFFERTCD